jgi:hypothetical protein
MAAVIWKLLVEGWPGAARSFVLALALLLCATTLGEAAEPADATIVLQLQLPPSTSPEAVRGLIADLAAKGARPVMQPTKPPDAAALPTFSAAYLAARVWDGSKQAIQALPVLRQAPQIWIGKVEADGGTPDVALGFWIVALAGLATAPLIAVAFRTLVDRQQARVSEARPTPRLWVAVIRFLAELASLALFGVFLWAALLWISRGVPILGESARPAGLVRSKMATSDHRLIDRRFAAAGGSPPARVRRHRRPDLLPMARRLFCGDPA